MKNYDSDINQEMERAWKGSYENLSEDVIEDSWNDFSKTISKKKNHKKSHLIKIYSAAAIFVALLAGYAYLSLSESSMHIVNNSIANKEVNLPDGSLVILQPGSEIEYAKEFEKRNVSLKGNAFFDVVRDTLKRFEVKTQATTTTVLGTSFLIEEEDENASNTRVTLFSGRVLVSIKDKAESFAIIPGESLVYKNGRTSIEKFETILSFEAGNKFIDVNYLEIEKLFDFLSDRFGYEFHTDSIMENKRVTLRINKSDSLEQVLNILSIINKTNYEVNKEQKKVTIFKK
ncbi:FecR family protein [Salegentibacter sediminis]|uniref:FecR family protein n=1 Tax=Salegentibacter sediminis TaxID=1930251 RepID=UPI0009BD0150|nr:FecR family protein [Salegentibacter sediminis]